MNNRNLINQSPKPKVPSMKLEKKRIASFTHIHWPFKNKLSPRNLAACGLFYDGLGDDFVRCFHCEVILGNWSEYSDPWLEHALASNNCFYLNCRRISQVQTTSNRRRPRHRHPVSSERRIPSETITQPPISDREWQENNLSQPSTSDILSDLEHAPASTVYSRVISPVYSPVSPPYIPEIIEPARPARYQHIIQLESDESDLEDPSTLYQSIPQDPEPFYSTPSSSTSLDLTITCKICLEEPMNIVLQPCNHLLMCNECSKNVIHCPICRQSIRRRYKIIVC